MLEEDTLGCTGTARCVHDAAKVLGLGRDRVDWRFLALLGKVIEALNSEMGMGILELVNVRLVDIGLAVVDDVLDLDVFALLEWLDELGEEMRVEEDGLCVGLLERVLETFLAESVVCCDNGHGLGRGACKRFY